LKRRGILGGSFDPVHLGHLWIATFAMEQIPLDQVLLIPAASPPHKTGGPTAPYAFRLDLARRAVADRPGFMVSDIEADPDRPSYTVETLRRLKREFPPEDEMWLLLGEDSLRDLPTWREPDEILKLCFLAIYGRPGYAAEIPQGARARWIDGPACGLSSSWIRQRLCAGLPVDALVPAPVAAILQGPGPYRQG
jgi:nicotinate-nucleotide adenylyltransferase